MDDTAGAEAKAGAGGDDDGAGTGLATTGRARARGAAAAGAAGVDVQVIFYNPFRPKNSRRAPRQKHLRFENIAVTVKSDIKLAALAQEGLKVSERDNPSASDYWWIMEDPKYKEGTEPSGNSLDPATNTALQDYLPDAFLHKRTRQVVIRVEGRNKAAADWMIYAKHAFDHFEGDPVAVLTLAAICLDLDAQLDLPMGLSMVWARELAEAAPPAPAPEAEDEAAAMARLQLDDGAGAPGAAAEAAAFASSVAATFAGLAEKAAKAAVKADTRGEKSRRTTEAEAMHKQAAQAAKQAAEQAGRAPTAAAKSAAAQAAAAASKAKDAAWAAGADLNQFNMTNDEEAAAEAAAERKRDSDFAREWLADPDWSIWHRTFDDVAEDVRDVAEQDHDEFRGTVVDHVARTAAEAAGLTEAQYRKLESGFIAAEGLTLAQYIAGFDVKRLLITRDKTGGILSRWVKREDVLKNVAALAESAAPVAAAAGGQAIAKHDVWLQLESDSAEQPLLLNPE